MPDRYSLKIGDLVIPYDGGFPADQVFVVKVARGNTAPAMTVHTRDYGTVPLTLHGKPLQAGDIRAGQLVHLNRRTGDVTIPVSRGWARHVRRQKAARRRCLFGPRWD